MTLKAATDKGAGPSRARKRLSQNSRKSEVLAIADLLSRPLVGYQPSMTFHARRAKLASIQIFCLGALAFAASPAFGQAGGADMYTLEPAAPAPIPVDPALAPPVPAEPSPGAKLPVTPALVGAPARWQIDGGLLGSVYSIHYGSDGSLYQDEHGNRGSLFLGPTLYLTPVIDDDAPRSLQPFLQRTSALSASLTGGGFVTHSGEGVPSRNFSWIGAGAAVNAYLTRSLALTAGLSYAYDVVHQEVVNKSHTFAGSAGLGVRFGDARVDASYAFNARDTDGTFAKVRWGAVNLQAYFVFARAFSLQVSGRVAEDGGSAGVDLGYYPTKDVGLFLGGSGRAFVYVDSDTRAGQYTGWGGLSCWVTPALRLYGSYSLVILDESEQLHQTIAVHETEHILSFTLSLRFP